MKLDCQHIIHPFQEDPGVSQRERSRKILVKDPPKIDGRTLADLLDYFLQLAPHVNYYDSQLNTSDWQPFFKKSKPFILAGIVKFITSERAARIGRYNKLFNKKPSKHSLQLLVSFIYNNNIRSIISWYTELKDEELPVSATMESLMRRTLGEAFRKFKEIHDDAVKRYCIQRLDLSSISAIVPSPNINTGSEHKWNKGRTRRERMKLMRDELLNINQALVYALQMIAGSAQKSIGRSLIPLQDKFQKNHLPHLGLLFAFIKLFRYLQKDLNSITRKQLDYFYKEVLKIKPAEAVADEAHVVFEIQKQLKKYLLKKGLLVKDGKDNNKAEIYFSLEEDIVVNKAQVVDQRALHLDNGYAHDYRYLKGLSIANDLTMADGVDKPFPDGQPKNYPTTGAALSKYIIPGTSLFKPYPRARVGFVLASPVLLLNEGNRTIDIHINCFLDEFKCDELNSTPEQRDPCCEEHIRVSSAPEKRPLCSSGMYTSGMFLKKVSDMLNQQFYYVSQPLIQEALKNGITKAAAANLMNFLLAPDNKLCYCPVEQHSFDRSVESEEFKKAFTDAEFKSLKPWFTPRRILQVSFSGEKEWIVPYKKEDLTITLANIATGLDLHIQAKFDPKVDAITYFDGKALKEKLDTKLPVVKVMLDDSIKIYFDDGDLGVFARHEKIKKEREQPDCCPDNSDCCVRRNDPSGKHEISLYHFFRNLVVANTENTRIDVQVCGVKNLVVQNDENIENVNEPIRLFGSRPKINSSFYLGSGEIFTKNWQDIWINVHWKDRPVNFGLHYEHYAYEPFEDGTNNITDSSFKIRSAILENGKWEINGQRRLFKDPTSVQAIFCSHAGMNYDEDVYNFSRNIFTANPFVYIKGMELKLLPFNVSSFYGFIRLTLEGVGFQHDRYPFVLSRHMMALANLVDPVSLNAAIVQLQTGEALATQIRNRVQTIIGEATIIKARILNIIDKLTHDGLGPININVDGLVVLINETINKLAGALLDLGGGAPGIPAAVAKLGDAGLIAQAINNNIGFLGNPNSLVDDSSIISAKIDSIEFLSNNDPDFNPHTAHLGLGGINELVITLLDRIDDIKKLLKVNDALKNGLPQEPYTPAIKSLSVDYTATADISDIQLIHLYPFKDTYKKEEIKQQPSLFPLHCNEGSLFMGIKDLEPGSNLNILFQLAEATADTEADKAVVQWHYLSNNQWKPLRPGFEVLEDKTAGLTASGIVKFATPEDMTHEDTIVPTDKEANLFWIKASVIENSRAVCETIGIHAQAILTTFTNEDNNDKLRLSQPLPAGSIAKLQVADVNVKKTGQPYDSFGGMAAEKSGHYYERVSELLRHKGRAIQKFDYERIILEAFPQVYRTKCISHSFALDARKYITDFPIAPGYVTVGVIPDLNKVKAGKMFEPGLATAVLEKIADLVKKRTSPFVRLRIMNPRYEKINICLKVKLVQGKDEKYFKEKMEQDIRTFLAPWAVGEYSKLKFGQCINHSDLVGFLESKDYLDYILDLQWGRESDWDNGLTKEEKQQPDICPMTPRSILIGGRIDICVFGKDCEE